MLPPGTRLASRRRPVCTDTPIPSLWTNLSAHLPCEVDIETGVYQILRYIVSEDCGAMINPMVVVKARSSAGPAQGIGGALYEHLIYDDDGNPLTTTFLDYLLPTATEMPILENLHLETPVQDPAGSRDSVRVVRSVRLRRS